MAKLCFVYFESNFDIMVSRVLFCIIVVCVFSNKTCSISVEISLIVFGLLLLFV